MRDPDFDENVSSPVKTHEEILELIDEIKELENRFPEIKTDQRWITVEPEVIVPEQKPTEIKTEIEEYSKKEKKKLIKFRIKRRSHSEVQKIRRESKATTIKLRIDEEGNLVNTDIRKQKKGKEGKSKFNIKKLLRREKEKTVEGQEGETTETEDKKGGISKIKNVFGGIGKLKNVRPGRKSKSEEPEKTSEETEETEE